MQVRGYDPIYYLGKHARRPVIVVSQDIRYLSHAEIKPESTKFRRTLIILEREVVSSSHMVCRLGLRGVT